MFYPISTAICGATALTVAMLGIASPASARPDSGGTARKTAPPTCTALAARNFDVDIDEDGEGNISVADDGVENCDESVVLWSLANSTAAIDNHEPIIDQVVVQVSELEQAGPTGIDFSLELDPCWAGFQVLRDGDSLVHEEMIGDGCEMTVDVDFTGSPASAEIHVVQQTGTIAPPYFWTAVADGGTHLTGLPSGTWYVKVFDGFTVGSSISVAGGASTNSDTLYDVPHGSHVDIEIATMLGFTSSAANEPSRTIAIDALAVG